MPRGRPSVGEPAHLEHVRESERPRSGAAERAKRAPPERNDRRGGAETGAGGLRAGTHHLVVDPSASLLGLARALAVPTAATTDRGARRCIGGPNPEIHRGARAAVT